ncbi:hypothetical protein [Flavobacterium sp. ALD4]|nr:hypothetical protein [Flavobacterium sp. ALD4]
MKTICYIFLKIISLFAAIVIGLCALVATAVLFPFVLLSKNND